MKRRTLLILISAMLAASTAFGYLAGCSENDSHGLPPADGSVSDCNTPDDTPTDNTAPDGTEPDNGSTGGGNDNTGGNNNNDNNDTGLTETSNKLTATTIDVYYTDSNNWGSVYAYMWNSISGVCKQSWPGERLTAIGVSGFGQKQYCVKADRTAYDRIIFNNGGQGNNERKTIDLTVGGATSGYYGTDGIFTMGDNIDYGKVRTTTLTDTANLNYLSGCKKTVSV